MAAHPSLLINYKDDLDSETSNTWAEYFLESDLLETYETKVHLNLLALDWKFNGYHPPASEGNIRRTIMDYLIERSDSTFRNVRE
jgi:hypothetical protein